MSSNPDSGKTIRRLIACLSFIALLWISYAYLLPFAKSLLLNESIVTTEARLYIASIKGSSKLVLAEMNNNPTYKKSVTTSKFGVPASVDAEITAQVKFYYAIDINSPAFEVTISGNKLHATCPKLEPLEPSIHTDTIQFHVEKSFFNIVNEQWFKDQMLAGYSTYCQGVANQPNSINSVLPHAKEALENILKNFSDKYGYRTEIIDVTWNGEDIK